MTFFGNKGMTELRNKSLGILGAKNCFLAKWDIHIKLRTFMHLFPLCVYGENLAEINLSYEFGLF